MVAMRRRVCNRQGQQRGRYDENAWCDHHQQTGHHTNHCFNPQAAVANRTRPVASNMANATSAPAANAAIAEDVRFAFMAHTTINHSTLLARASTSDVVVDSGATHHMVHDRSLLSNITTLARPAAITVGNGAVIKATQYGSLHLPRITLENVLLVPGLGRNLLSVGSSQASGQHWTFANNKATLIKGDRPLLMANPPGWPLHTRCIQ